MREELKSVLLLGGEDGKDTNRLGYTWRMNFLITYTERKTIVSSAAKFAQRLALELAGGELTNA